MRRTGKIAVGVVVAAIGFVTLSAFGGPGHWRHGQFSEEHAQKFATFIVDKSLDDVNATDAQRTQINALKDQVVRDMSVAVKARKETAQKLLVQWESDKPDAKAVHAAIDERIEEMRKVAHQAADDALQVHEILTPGQRATLTAKIKSRMGEK